MNANFGSAFPAGRTQPYAPGQHPQRNAVPDAATPARPAAGQPATARAELDLSDSALTRRDIPRGSLVNIVT